MADNNPYSKKAVSEQLPFLAVHDLFCVYLIVGLLVTTPLITVIQLKSVWISI